ncbi:MAG: hypothetical protein ACXW1S_10545 [Acidimicrobiia bacterium]
MSGMVSPSPVGPLGAARLTRVDRRGGVSVDGCAVTFEWWIGAEDRWHVAANEPAVRRRRLGPAPAYETAMRVPSGEVFHRVYAIGGAGDPVVVEIENDSPVPVALALVVRGARAGIDVGAARVDLERGVRLHATRPAPHVVAAADANALLAAVERGGGDTAPTTVPAGSGAVALLHPVAHRTRVRFALVLDPEGLPELDLVAAPTATDAARGWEAMLRRGMQIVVADAARQLAIDQARADVLLEAGRVKAGPEVFAALEDWGLDAEAVQVWKRLGWRARRLAAQRRFGTKPDTRPTAATVLRATRDAMIDERRDGAIVLAPEPPRPGESLEVHEAPTRAGSVSYAVRWHGTRPALLWDVHPRPGSLRLVAPGLDPDWSTDEPSGEALLGPAPVNAGGA